MQGLAVVCALRFAAPLAASMLALLASSAPAAVAAKPISGKLSKPGYTVIALDASGRASIDRAPRGRFEVRPPARRVALQLRAPDGTYAGPVVVGKRKQGRRAITGVMAGAKLGQVKVNSTKGFAKLELKLPERQLDRTREVKATKGRPIGAGNFGRVRSKLTGNSPPGDLDRDGVPDALDIDDDGDLILDLVDRSTGAGAAQAPREILDIGTGLGLPLYDTVNANIVDSSGVRVFSDAQIEAALPGFGVLGIEILPGVSAELDCGATPNPAPPPPAVGGLVYCAYGGTARVPTNLNPPEGPEFPECCDSDGDGFGTLADQVDPVGASFAGLLHGATTAQIATGDLLTEWVSTESSASPCPLPDGTLSASCSPYVGSVQFVFATVPALISYSDRAMPAHSATVSYPVDGPGDPGGPDPGTHGNGFPVSAAAGDDLLLDLTLVRPQRRPTSEAECAQPPQPQCTQQEWIDIGRLLYDASISDIAFKGPAPGGCPQEAFQNIDPELTPAPQVPSTNGGLLDTAADRPARPTNTLTFTLNVTQCLRGAQLNPGEEFDLVFSARPSSQGGLANTGVRFKLVE